MHTHRYSNYRSRTSSLSSYVPQHNPSPPDLGASFRWRQHGRGAFSGLIKRRECEKQIWTGREFHTESSWYWKDLAPTLLKLILGTEQFEENQKQSARSIYIYLDIYISLYIYDDDEERSLYIYDDDDERSLSIYDDDDERSLCIYDDDERSLYIYDDDDERQSELRSKSAV